jgi:hypothetical protein
MSEPYNLFSGQSLERLTALSDGLFAVAMTLLVLDMRVPVSSADAVYTERGLWEALLRLGPSFAAYLLSFTMLGTFWLAQHTLLGILGPLRPPAPGRGRVLAEHPAARRGARMGCPVRAQCVRAR